MDARIRVRPSSPQTLADDLARVAALWNEAAASAHGFYPLDAQRLRARFSASDVFDPALLFLAFCGDGLVGMAHGAGIREPYYETAGVVEAVCVATAFRRRGIGRMLVGECVRALEGQGFFLIDGGGCWPYSPLYATLIDGSERSGVTRDDPAATGVFLQNGFVPDVESRVMELTGGALEACAADSLDIRYETHSIPRRGETTWLDRCFAGWDLVEHQLRTRTGTLLSRCILAPMAGLGAHMKTVQFALFGVQTSPGCRRQGFGFQNLRRACRYAQRQGAERIELHVQAANAPAVCLYEKLGFREIRRTVSLRRRGADKR